MTSQAKRITVKLKTPNPLFEKWLIEWKDQAVANNSKMQHTFNNALKSLRKYPLPFDCGKDCIILKGFGNNLCDMLDNKLREHQKNGGPIPLQINSQNTAPNAQKYKTKKKNDETTTTNSPKKSRPSKSYQPAKGSGGYGILIALLKKSQEPYYAGSLSKDVIIEVAKDLVDKSFVRPDPGSFYTAWSSMSTLITKGLVEKKGSPPKFSLTDEGEILAVTLFENHTSVESEEHVKVLNINHVINEVFSKGNNNVDVDKLTQKSPDYKINYYDNLLTDCRENFNNFYNDPNESLLKNQKMESYNNPTPSTSEISETFKNELFDNSLSNSKNVPESFQIEMNKNKKLDLVNENCSQASSNFETIIFAPNTFDIILLVDTQETAGSKNKVYDETLLELTKCKANFEVRHLKVGDFTWICRERCTNHELVLPYIVERKRMDDLGYSIKDGRFHEQKFRLKQCGIQNLIYIVENYGNNARTALPLSSLLQAATNTLIQDQFQVKFTENQRHSMQYLSAFTLMLQHIYGVSNIKRTNRQYFCVFSF